MQSQGRNQLQQNLQIFQNMANKQISVQHQQSANSHIYEAPTISILDKKQQYGRIIHGKRMEEEGEGEAVEASYTQGVSDRKDSKRSSKANIILEKVLFLLQFSNIMAINFIEYRSQKIILQLFMVFFFLGFAPLTTHLILSCCLYSKINRTKQIQKTPNSILDQNIIYTLQTKPKLGQPRLKMDQNKTKKLAFAQQNLQQSQNVSTIKKFLKKPSSKDQPKQSSEILFNILALISKLANIITNIVFSSLSLAIYNRINTTLSTLIQVQIVAAYCLSLLNLYITYYNYISDRYQSKIMDQHHPIGSPTGEVNMNRSVQKKTSLDQEIPLKYSLNQERIIEQQDSIQDKARPKILCHSLRQKQFIDLLSPIYNQHKNFSEVEKEWPGLNNIRQELKKSVLKHSKSNISNKNKQIAQDLNGEKKKVQINFNKNQVFQYSNILPSNSNSPLESPDPKEMLSAIKKKKQQNIKKHQNNMLIEMQLLKKKRLQRELTSKSHKVLAGRQQKAEATIQNSNCKFNKESHL